ncbi:helix-turn-helix transcriptional regulator [Rhodobacteraceae bacterium G21628-S1]|nr:helix-turn-helix transcriptional regulator [Rhodobacteraceae bacterium G21628-S1]
MEDEELTEPFLVRLKAVIDADPDLNVSKLATDAGLANSTIRKMFRDNKNPRSSTMRKICAALGTTLEDFMGEARTPEQQEIVRLALQLPDHLLKELLGYGRGLAAAADLPQRESDEEK